MPSFKAFADFQKRIQPAQGQGAQESDGATAQDAGEPELERLRVGVRVRVVGLRARPELNDLVGTLVAEDTARSRWQVLLESGGQKLFKATNLEPAPLPSTDADLDASKGAATGPAPQPAARQVTPTPVDTAPATPSPQPPARQAAPATPSPQPAARQVEPAPVDTAAVGRRGAGAAENRDPVPPAQQDQFQQVRAAENRGPAAPAGAGGRPAADATHDSAQSRGSGRTGAFAKRAEALSKNAPAELFTKSAPVEQGPLGTSDEEPEDFDAFVAGIELCLKDSDVLWDEF